MWRLSPDVFLADVRGDLVFMNAKRNEYSCIPRTTAGPVRSLLASGSDDNPDDEDLALELVSAGLVEIGEAPYPTKAPMAARADFHDLAASDLEVGPGAWFRLLFAAFETAIRLRFSKPARWLRLNRTSGETGQVVRACTLALQFDKMRPLIPRSGRCLPNSMLLLAYLRRHRIFGTWVFGVQTFPFEAHCWVEYDGVVLNDTIEHVRWYTPITAA